ncbi:MAG TPA: hypothetical protein VLJ39_20790 [Tepidisphaeraceae bacterium]|nr:hypothetical protein [Tepidisphaeraceae bacterium]
MNAALSRSLRAAPVLLVLVFAVGCAEEPPGEQPTLASWRKNVEQYVWEHGNGDPTILADMSWDDVHRGFAVIGDAQPGRSTDVIGLLVAHRRAEGGEGVPYFLFLVGVVDRDQLQELRAVALNVQGNQFHWYIGEDSPPSLARYRAWAEADRREAKPADPDPPAFPRPGDVFDVKIENGSEFEILHRATGAAWGVNVSSASETFPATQPYSNSSSSVTSRSK